MKSLIKAVIFDFGGVITSSPFEAFNRLETARGLPRDFIRSVNARNPDSNAWARLERSEIDREAFDTLFADEAECLGHRLPGALVLDVLAGDIRPEMVAALDILRQSGYRLGCITNNIRGARGPAMAREEGVPSRFDPVFERFEHVLESARAKVRKPDPRIYAMMCELLGLEPSACVYLDDLGVNCKPAAEMGMQAIKVESATQALNELSRILGLELAA